MIDKNVCRLYTFHNTEIFIDGEFFMVHRNVEFVPADHLPLYALRADDGIILFFVRDNHINYIRKLVENNKCIVGDQPVATEFVTNDDGSISFKQGNKFLSARLENGQFDLRPRNLDWEHLFPDDAGFSFDELVRIAQNDFKLPSFTVQHSPYKISIVIPVLDDASTIETTIKSIIEQTFQEFEIIIVKGLRAELPSNFNALENSSGDKIAFIDTHQNTIGALCNVGINFSNGQYVMLVESGDILQPSTLETLYSIAESRKADVVYPCAVDNTVSVPFDAAKRVHDFVNGRFGADVRAGLLSRKFLAANRIEFPKLSAAEELAFSFYLACRAKNYVLVPDQFYRLRADVEELPNDQNFFIIINEVFEALDKFMREIDLFNRHPEFKFLVFNRFNEYCQKYLHRENLTPYEFYEQTLKLVRDNRAAFNRTAFLSYNLNSANYRYAQLLKKDRRIKELNEEIKKLKAETIA